MIHRIADKLAEFDYGSRDLMIARKAAILV
jgi:hypothetical protein